MSEYLSFLLTKGVVLLLHTTYSHWRLLALKSISKSWLSARGHFFISGDPTISCEPECLKLSDCPFDKQCQVTTTMSSHVILW